MYASDLEKEIQKLDPQVSKIYFEAKHELIHAQDSHNERFASAARIVRAFWKKFIPGP